MDCSPAAGYRCVMCFQSSSLWNESLSENTSTQRWAPLRARTGRPRRRESMSASPDVTHPRLHELKDLPVDSIRKNQENPRIHFTEEEMQRLTESIAIEGILVPVVVYPEDDHYVLIDGERRWRCAQS